MPVGRMRGQALVESLVVMLTIAFVVSAAIQLLWLFMLQQLIQAAAIQATKDAARTGLDPIRMRASYVERLQNISGLQPQLFTFEVLHPSHDERPTTTGFDRPRMAELDSQGQEAYLRSRILVLEFTHCLDLKVPLIGAMLTFLQQHYNPTAACSLLPSIQHPYVLRVRSMAPIESVLR